ncbi:thiamine transport system substrate-binding protein [Ketogulonicigenium robustum]|uniref:Thiamine transport system substrate-binding protein n=1 Tax=Ketogulonicigenium robustum TaxID=92947 RepID=A0A1W6P2Q8_9RHOB|nr:thiamine ABC transporter substrate binding subunit [Ketogulonicigenium robustum]ARO15766.1 thiamine transport system substrate-binding protein [Ketogulonicigenium robustum]
MRFAAALASAGLFISAGMAHADTPVLTIYTYDSFTSEWGPGPAVKTAFEAECACTVQFVAAGDGAALLARLQMEGSTSDADILLGLDTNLTAAAKATGLFAPHGVTPDVDLPLAWDDPVFLPYDWSHFAMIGRVGGPTPASFRELAASDASVIIMDPRSSTPGLGLLMWVKAAYGDEAAQVWADLRDNIVTVTPGWSEGWGLFLKGESDLVLSYATSPAYNIVVENDHSLQALPFDEGHYMQVEVAAKLAGARQPELADAFLRFMLTPAFQSVIPETNWMYPAVMPEGGLGAGWDDLLRPATSLLLPEDEAQALRGPAVDEWRDALAQ